MHLDSQLHEGKMRYRDTVTGQLRRAWSVMRKEASCWTGNSDLNITPVYLGHSDIIVVLRSLFGELLGRAA